jgi:hypothetical protein
MRIDITAFPQLARVAVELPPMTAGARRIGSSTALCCSSIALVMHEFAGSG